MKAIASLLMLLVCTISITGFSNTTTDLSENSSATEIHLDKVANVVAVVSVDQELQTEVLWISKNALNPIQNDLFGSGQETMNPITPVNDVGKQSVNDNPTNVFTPKVYRSPRDGLNCRYQ